MGVGDKVVNSDGRECTITRMLSQKEVDENKGKYNCVVQLKGSPTKLLSHTDRLKSARSTRSNFNEKMGW